MLLQHLDDVIVGLIYVLAGEQRRIGQIDAATVHRVVDGQVILQAEGEVLLTVAGGGVDCTGAGIQGDVLADTTGTSRS